MNYYEELDLPCDVNLDEKKHISDIEQRLKQWKQAKESAFSNESNNLKKNALKEELNEFPRMEQLLTDASLRKKHADELKKQRLVQTESIAAVIEQCSPQGKRIARPRVQRLATRMRLRLGSVSKVFTDRGFVIEPPKPAAIKDFVFSDNDPAVERIRNAFTILKAHFAKNPHDNNAALAQAETLYDYIAILDGNNIQTRDEYKVKPTDILRDIFDKLRHAHAMGNDVFTKNARDIESVAATQIFKDDPTREKYDNYLKLADLESLFTTLRMVPDSVKLDTSFAEECIKMIQRIFGDEDQAIALYNAYSGLPSDQQYEKESIKIAIICASCRTENLFDTIKEAQQAKCKCGAALFQKCPQCGTLSPAIADYCSNSKCGFFFKGAKSFDLYYERFELAVKELNISAAEDNYIKAKQSNSSEARLSDMGNKLDKLKKDLEKPIQEINTLIDEKRFVAAQDKANKLKAVRPGVDLKQYQIQITKAMDEAKRIFSGIEIRPGITERQALEICMRTLGTVKDYPNAQEWLLRHAPKPVHEVNFQPDAKALTCTLQWEDHPENGYVKYRVVRKANARPKNGQDGEVVSKEQDGKTYKDSGLKPGVLYVYAVFAVRGDTESVPCYPQNSVLLLKCIESVKANISQRSCTLSWTDISGSKGVRIRRSEGGKPPVEIAQCAVGGVFTDKSIKNNLTYRYYFDTVWEVNGTQYFSERYNEILTKDVHIEERPSRIDIRVKHIGEDGYCEVSWDAKGEGTLRLIRLKNTISVKPDQVYCANQMKDMGEVLDNIPVSAGHFVWYASVGKQFQVAGLRIFGDEAVGGAPVVVNTVPPLKMDREKLSIRNNILQFSLAEVPDDVTCIYYMLSTNGQILTEDMARRNTAYRINIQEYKNQGSIRIENVPRGMITVSMMTMYGTGQQVYYSPVNQFTVPNLPKEKVYYRIKWETKGIRHKPVRKGAELIITVSGKRLPEMWLCCRRDGKMIFNEKPTDASVVRLAHASGRDAEPGTEYFCPIDEQAMRGVPEGAFARLLLASGEESFFDAQTTASQSLKIPAP